jgi:hypothetical protein
VGGEAEAKPDQVMHHSSIAIIVNNIKKAVEDRFAGFMFYSYDCGLITPVIARLGRLVGYSVK